MDRRTFLKGSASALAAAAVVSPAVVVAAESEWFVPAGLTRGVIDPFAGLPTRFICKDDVRTFLDGFFSACDNTDIVDAKNRATLNALLKYAVADRMPIGIEYEAAVTDEGAHILMHGRRHGEHTYFTREAAE